MAAHTFYSIYGSNFRKLVEIWKAGKPLVLLLVKDKTKPVYLELLNFNQRVAHSLNTPRNSIFGLILNRQAP